MIVTVDGVDVHASTGGVAPAGDDAVIVLIHGAGMDSTVWQLQTRYLAHRGYRAIAVDLPAHGRSAGEPLSSITDMASWIIRFLDAADVRSAHLVGHSMGTFVTLESAAQHPSRITSIVLCGTATAMPVHPELLDAADRDLPRAAALMAAWGHSKPAQVGTNPTPGLWMTGGARALVETSRPGVLATDFRACASYDRAEAAAAAVTCPATVVVGRADKMTPAAGGRAIAAALPSSRIIELDATGHQMMTENPSAVKQAILASVEAAPA